MAVIRRNPELFSGLAIAVVLTLAAGWLLWPSPEPTLAQEGHQPLDAVAAGQVDILRQDAGLDDNVLAALDLTDVQLETVLAELRDWYDTNSATLISAWSALGDQRARVRLLESAIAMGENRATALANARQQLVTLETQYETLLAGLRTAAWGEVGASQRALAQRMHAQQTLPMPFRVLDLSAGQQENLHRLLARHHQRLAVTRDPQQRAAVQRQYRQELERVIGASGMQTLAALDQYLGASSQRVVAAVQTVLPLRPEG